MASSSHDDTSLCLNYSYDKQTETIDHREMKGAEQIRDLMGVFGVTKQRLVDLVLGE